MPKTLTLIAEDPTSLHALVDDAVVRISWFLPWPSSGNTQIGYRLRQGRLWAELVAYCELYQEWSGCLPTLDHAIAVGAFVYRQPDFNRSLGQKIPLHTSEETFEDIWEGATNLLDRLPHAQQACYDPFQRSGKARRRTHSGRLVIYRKHKPAELVETSLSESSRAKLDDLVYYYGSPSTVIQRALALLWKHTALRRQSRFDPDKPWPEDPAEAWERIRAKSNKSQNAKNPT